MVSSRKLYLPTTELVNPPAQVFAIAVRRADRQGNASTQSRRNDNLCTVLVRRVFSAAIFQRVAAKRNEADRHVDDEPHETVREAA